MQRSTCWLAEKSYRVVFQKFTFLIFILSYFNELFAPSKTKIQKIHGPVLIMQSFCFYFSQTVMPMMETSPVICLILFLVRRILILSIIWEQKWCNLNVRCLERGLTRWSVTNLMQLSLSSNTWTLTLTMLFRSQIGPASTSKSRSAYQGKYLSKIVSSTTFWTCWATLVGYLRYCRSASQSSVASLPATCS